MHLVLMHQVFRDQLSLQNAGADGAPALHVLTVSDGRGLRQEDFSFFHRWNRIH